MSLAAHQAAVEAAVDQAAAALGGIDILVNNAGIFLAAPADDLSLEDFDATMAVNLRAPFVAVRAVLPHMGEGGRIVAMSSVAGLTGNRGQASYSAAKAGVVAFTKSLALEMAKREILVTCVAPGFVESDHVKRIGGVIKRCVVFDAKKAPVAIQALIDSEENVTNGM